ncbi:SpoIIE family protein phosphatase [bacterium]|nr:SpoIIE family protein phosphatase [bacterium]
MITNIKSRLLLTLVPILVILFGLLVYISFKESKETVLKQITRESYELARSHAKEFDVLFESARMSAEGLALSLSDSKGCSKENVLRKLRHNLKKDQFIYGSTASFIPSATRMGSFAPYFYRIGDSLIYNDLDTDDYNYTSWEWFTRPIADGHGSWSEPYFDEGGGSILMTTYSEIIKCNGKTVGVATIDIALDELVSRIKKLHIGQTGYAFIISKDGHFIAYPGEDILSSLTIWEMIENSETPAMRDFAKLIKPNVANYIEMPDPFFGKKSWIITTEIQSTGWTFTIVYPSDEILKPLITLRNKAFFFAGLIVIILIAVVILISSTVTSPLKRLVRQIKEYTDGNYEQRLSDQNGPKEIRDLSRAFNTMGAAISEHIENIRKTTAQKERYRHELTIAAEIQRSILPHEFPPFPELADLIDIYGFNRPALEIGGDYFDFFRLHGGKIALIIADVSDKGAPASFFMAMTRILIREVASQGHSPAEILRRVNHRLAQGNLSSMFVTLLYCEYKLDTGDIRLACAGHNAPICIYSDGRVEQIPMNVGLPLGALPTTHYQTTEFQLPTSSTMFLYTDGITEAMDKSGKEFGLEKLAFNLKGANERECKEIAHEILDKIDNFADGAPQCDDITMLILNRKYNKEPIKYPTQLQMEKSTLLRLPAHTNVLDKIATLAEQIANDCGFDNKATYQIKLALDEIVNNVIMHAYSGNPSETFQIKFIPFDGGLKIEIIDYGIPFDFKEKLDRYDGKATADQAIGGIGLYLVKQFVDEVHYEPETVDGNKVTIIKLKAPKGE